MTSTNTQIEFILVIFKDYFSLGELTDLLGINPTKSWIKGDLILPHNGLFVKDNMVRFRQETVWQFSTGFIKTLDFDDVYYQFEKVFKNKFFVLKKYIQKNKLKTVIEIVVEIVDEAAPSIHFNKKLIKICKELGAEVDIDMYLINND